MLLHPLDEFKPVTIREAHVRETDIEALARKLRLGTLDVACNGRIDIHAPERERQQLANVGLIVNDQCQGLAHELTTPSQRSGSANTILNMLPPPSRG